MSAKNIDRQGRWRNKVVAFRISPEENAQLDIAVRLSGLTKQDYITRHLLGNDIIVVGNPRVYKALKNELANVLCELQRLTSCNEVSTDLRNTIDLITITMFGMKEEGEGENLGKE